MRDDVRPTTDFSVEIEMLDNARTRLRPNQGLSALM